ncbi:threonine/homoserine/homoserine lactone efflux protein [Sulfitobacter undariae]|uniref:Threonine/homoserine/homoserine lactone efflux protein n=1 Tax=Sulfitobacter undariae TaxID=1563671 RepID=A0A7W6GZY8_9RHOB|nr:LysE family transporter [Sulfitobacter undariae]MBB3994055.1 threonine/homoserine/homoserine lactone efflux protein [Sulfitobacter undariae]
MLTDINLPLILLAAFIAGASPGPATLAIAGTSMGSGRVSGLFLASGITTGSLIWSVAAALGLGTIMLANAWMFEIIRYFGAAYLMFLAYKSARSAFSKKDITPKSMTGAPATLFTKGLLLHLTNPKAILFFGSLYSLGIPVGASLTDLAIVIAAVGLQSTLVFHGYALLFSSKAMTRLYLRLRRWFEGAFAIGFGAASFKILTAKL